MVGIKHESMRKGQTSHKKEHNTRMCFPLKPVFTRDKGGLPNFIDEPTAGLDPKERIHLKNLLNQYGEKHTVIISTHIVSDVEDISKAIILLKKGEICEQGDLDVLLKKIEGFVYEGTVPKTQLDYFMNKYRVRNVYDLGNTIRIRIITEDNVEKCFVPIEATLNDLYLYYFDEVSEDD